MSAGTRYDTATKAAAQALADRGFKPAEIKRELRLDASLSTIMRWTNPGTAAKAAAYHAEHRDERVAYSRRYNAKHRNRLLPKRKRRQKQAFAALKRQEEERRVAKAGGSVAKAYALVRKATQELDRALFEVGQPLRPVVREALGELYKAEDAIVRASRTPDTERKAA